MNLTELEPKAGINGKSKQIMIKPKTLEDLLNTLDKREKKVLIHRFGLLGKEKKTLAKIGKDISLSRGRTGQIALKAIRKLRAYPRNIFFTLLPDFLLVEVFGTEDFRDIISQIDGRGRTIAQAQWEIINSIKKHTCGIRDYFNTVDRNYENLANMLKGSNFIEVLEKFTKIIRSLDSQCTNVNSSLQIAQKILHERIPPNSREMENILKGLGEHLFCMQEIERQLKSLIEFHFPLIENGVGKND